MNDKLAISAIHGEWENTLAIWLPRVWMGGGKPGIRKRKADVLTNRTIIINTRWQQLIAIRTLHHNIL